KVKVTIMFRGREQSRPELGFRLLQRLASDVEELGFVESQPRQDGRNMIMVIGPHKRKSDARSERANRDAHHERGSARSRAARAAAPGGGGGGGGAGGGGGGEGRTGRVRRSLSRPQRPGRPQAGWRARRAEPVPRLRAAAKAAAVGRTGRRCAASG